MARIDHAKLYDGLIGALLEAGACLLKHRAKGVAGETKADGSPVSAADREAEGILLAALARAAPDIPVIAEEAVSAGLVPDLRSGGPAFLVDALDGTRDYLTGADEFTVNIGLVEHGAPVFGMVLAPASGRVFATVGPASAVAGHAGRDELERGVRPLMAPITTVSPDARGLRVLSSRSSRSAETEDFLRRIPVRSDVRMSSSVKFCLIAAGEADLYPRFGPTSAWDIAAGHAILAAAGGIVTTPRGLPIDYLGEAHLAAPVRFLNGPFLACGRPETLDAARLGA